MERVIKETSKSELTKFLACLIAAAQYAERGVNLFSGFRGAAKKMKGRLRSKPDFSNVMSHALDGDQSARTAHDGRGKGGRSVVEGAWIC